MVKINTDLLIIGGGSAGFGASLNALKTVKGNINITLIEKNNTLGGTSTLAGVNCWEPGVGGLGIHHEIAEKLLINPSDAGVGKVKVPPNDERPWAISQIDRREDYESTLRRSGIDQINWRRFNFEAAAMSKIMYKMLSSYENIDILFNTEFISSEVRDGNIDYVYAVDRNNGITYKIYAKLYIDSSADIILARDCGCRFSFGEDAAVTYNEPSAPQKANKIINAITLLFRVQPSAINHVDPISNEFKDFDVSAWLENNVYNYKLLSLINEYPNGDLNINMLPTMEGAEYISLEKAEALHICKARVFHYWHWLQKEKGMSCYTFKEFFPMVGVRETYRLIGQYVLNENDIRAGFLNQKQKEEIIAFGDHALDTHGKTNVKGIRCGELEKPYGVPFRCLLTNEVENLLVACRGGSFSHIAASSCRLSRSMMALGEAAGTAAVMALEGNKLPGNIDVGLLRSLLAIPAFEEKIIKRWRL